MIISKFLFFIAYLLVASGNGDTSNNNLKKIEVLDLDFYNPIVMPQVKMPKVLSVATGQIINGNALIVCGDSDNIDSIYCYRLDQFEYGEAVLLARLEEKREYHASLALKGKESNQFTLDFFHNFCFALKHQNVHYMSRKTDISQESIDDFASKLIHFYVFQAALKRQFGIL